MKKALVVAAVLVVLIICGGVYMLFFMGQEDVTDDELPAVLKEDWVPYKVVQKEESPLEGFLFTKANKTDASEGSQVGTGSTPGSQGEKLTNGLPEGYPDKLVPLFRVKEVDEGNSYEDNGDFTIQYFSSGTYKEVTKFYRDTLNDKPSYEQIDQGEGEVWFRCRALSYDIEVRIYDMDGETVIQIDLYEIS